MKLARQATSNSIILAKAWSSLSTNQVIYQIHHHIYITEHMQPKDIAVLAVCSVFVTWASFI